MSHTLYWIRADKQGSIAMGDYATAQAAVAAIDGALVELLDQCSTDQDREEITAGYWSVETGGES